jgi:SWI/SNF-related matrix-associated actin-dependent regulator of chromatin subfamily A-like protein 1
VLDELDLHIKKKLGFNALMRIDGNTDARIRQSYVHSFQEDPATRVALLSITAAGVGLTLTAASVVIFAEVHWTPAMML